MKKLLLAAAILGAALPAMAQTSVSINVGQPGFYGHIDIGDFGPPPVVYTQPVIVQQPIRVVQPPPVVYLRVPPGHQKHWSKFCGRYNACGQRVYFVRDDWYLNTYAPRYREMHRPEHWDRGYEGRDRDRDDHGRGHDRDDHDGKHGHGHGHGHGRGHDD